MVSRNFKTYSRRFYNILQTSCQDIFKTSSKRLQDVLQIRLQDIFKTSSRHLQDVFMKLCFQIKKSSFAFSIYYTFQRFLTETYLEPCRTSVMDSFLREYLTALCCQLFLQKGSIIDAKFWLKIGFCLSSLLFSVCQFMQENTQPVLKRRIVVMGQ